MTKALHTSGKKVGLHTIAGKKERSAKQAILWSPTLLWLLYDNRGLLCGNGKIATVGKIWWLHPIYMAHMCSFYSIKDNTDTSLVVVVRKGHEKCSWVDKLCLKLLAAIVQGGTTKEIHYWGKGGKSVPWILLTILEEKKILNLYHQFSLFSM